MSKEMNTQSETQVWGVDPAVVAQAIQRGRVERSKAFIGLIRALFSVGGSAAGTAPTRQTTSMVDAMRT